MKSQGEPPPHPPLREAGQPAAASGNGRATWAALIVIVVVAALLLWVSQAIVAHNRLQNCIDSGRRTCLPAEPGNGGS
ncbi:hypothetical protein P7D22_20735 [Lichenihabitans sp. Uapishka_5]|uniref:hypothetical protein n=1 Tax=Lichenihabitans sp. Uapishka_5 TaxID=3037302 RepID=UPI0029E8035C|nr:hypothetical protein [Lichenihabitans sp. Uapishka_5]MDX7953594.1 hypothetical protein [Lichenihabitans sp. Uapishka_5]